MKALGLVVSDKKIFENCILKTYFLTSWPIYATNWNGLNNFDRGPPRDHSWKVWSKSNKWFQRRCCLKKLLTAARTDAWTMDDRQWAITKAHLEHFVLRWAKKEIISPSLDSKFCFKVQFITDIVKLSEHWLPWQLSLTLTPPTKADESLASSIWSNTLGYRSRAVAVPLPENIGATAASCRAASLVRKTEMKTMFVHTLCFRTPHYFSTK